MQLSGLKRTAFAALALAFGATCGKGSEQSELFVDLRTDMIPGVEFHSVLTIIGDGRDERFPVDIEMDFQTGARIAEFPGIRPGMSTIDTRLLDAEGRFVVGRTQISSLRNGATAVTIVVTRDCINLECGEGLTCFGGRCVSRECSPENLEACGETDCTSSGECGVRTDCAEPLCADGICLQVPVNERCATGQFCDPTLGCLDHAADAGPTGCVNAASCNDAIDCTEDSCEDGICRHVPDDAICTDQAEGTCSSTLGCTYPECVCEPGEECCGGRCVPAGCDDGNPCTDDGCTAEFGCQNTPNTAQCDDGTFCNGADTCADGSCSAHSGDPCASPTVCNEERSSCVGCVADGDCPAEMTGVWGVCSGFDDTCDLEGTRERTVTSYTCVDGACLPNERSESEACMRATDGVTCTSTEFSNWSSCGNFSNGCDDTGTEMRSRTDYACSGGTCTPSMTSETQSCGRDVTGCMCGDGTLYSGEGCDDGDVSGGDGCNGTCSVETGWSCNMASPSVCNEVCGDSMVVGGEVCDNNSQNRDQSCGNCGTQAQTRSCNGSCAWGSWTNVGGCADQGTCAAGATGNRTIGCGNCGDQDQTRTCSSGCAWGSWSNVGSCTGQGACSPGAMGNRNISCGDCGTQAQTRTCSSSCGWGSWTNSGGCTGEGVCSPGATGNRNINCGNCGTQAQTRTCTASCGWGSWTNSGSCTGQGACSPGATQNRTVGCGNCGTKNQQRTCNSSCGWGSWTDTSSCTGQGVCSPGSMQNMNQSCSCGKDCSGTESCTRTCTSSCAWTSWSCGSCS